MKLFKMSELVSIITPMYNSENFIEEAISSVLKQSYTNWEMLIIDDGSKDKSIEIVEKYLGRDNRIKLINGRSKEKQSPFAVETPILKPVYDPGPSLTAIADNCVIFKLDSFKTSSIKECNLVECEYFSSFFSFKEITLPFKDKEIEQLVVEDSIFSI